MLDHLKKIGEGVAGLAKSATETVTEAAGSATDAFGIGKPSEVEKLILDGLILLIEENVAPAHGNEVWIAKAKKVLNA